ncbi:uncharacterized protein LOC110732205 [Chenopodium quinoa]|uniref:uncharacterized protein LOC110732205 n=1 Tax=Chenopodium quinoa TaxID=63459 RepID=UPI000B77D87A|nr:uncharacterized protein LOC110732205 [Chenopodium quinoa]
MCGDMQESILHMLVFCKEAKLLWLYSPLRLDVEKFNGANFAAWWGKKKDMMDVIHRAVSMVGEFEDANAEKCKRSISAETLECCWKVPSSGIIKVNSDAAIFNTNQVGLGGVIRDEIRDVVVATCVQLAGRFEVEVAEAMAMRHAMKIAMESGFLKICLETDNLKLHHCLKKGRADPTEFGFIIKDILLLASSCHAASFAFVKRNGNRVAYSLAKLSCKYDGLRVWLEKYPVEIHEHVMADLSPSST